jgi:hypothetical protein
MHTMRRKVSAQNFPGVTIMFAREVNTSAPGNRLAAK